MQATTKRDRFGRLTRTTRIPLGFDRRELHIETARNDSNRTIETTASVVQCAEDGLSYAFAFGRGGDFSTRVASSPARATEKAIATLHDVVDLDQLVRQACAHYGRDAAELAANATTEAA